MVDVDVKLAPEKMNTSYQQDQPESASLLPSKRTMQTRLTLGPVNQLDQPASSTPQHQFKVSAYALLRFHDRDVPLSTKEAFLGRNPQSPAATTKSVHITISQSSKVSKTACRIYLDEESDLFACENLSRNTIMIDRQPVEQNSARSLFHKSLIQIGDSIFFFVLPNET